MYFVAIYAAQIATMHVKCHLLPLSVEYFYI